MRNHSLGVGGFENTALAPEDDSLTKYSLDLSVQENISNYVLTILFVLLTAHINCAFADTKIRDMPDLTTTNLNLECSEFIADQFQEANFRQGLCIGIILG